MPKLKRFISSTDYTTLKNDSDSVSVSVSIPAGQAIGPGASATWSTDVTVGSTGAPMFSTIKWSGNNLPIPGEIIQFVPTNFTGYVFVSRPTATTARITALLLNSDIVSRNTAAATFTAYIRTFIPPF